MNQTPLKTILLDPLCFFCQKSPHGQLRNIITNLALPGYNKVLNTIKECFDVDLTTVKNISINQCKICITCRRHLDICMDFRNDLSSAISRTSHSSEHARIKRMAHIQSPSSYTKDNKENNQTLPSNPKKKKRLQFSNMDVIPVSTSPKEPFMSKKFTSDHCYGSLLTPLEMAKSNSLLSKQDFFLNKDKHSKEIGSSSCECCTAEDIFRNKNKLAEIQHLILLETELIADKLCSLTISPGPSVLRTFQQPSLLKSEDILSKCLIEFHNCLPFVFKIFQTMSSSIFTDHEKASSANSTIATMYGMAMNRRNKDLCAVQKINTCVALRFHAGNDLLDIFNKSNMTLAASSKYGFLEEMGHFNNEGVIKSIREGKPGKLTVDNIDGMTLARDVRLTGGNKHYHYTASTYYPDRVDLSNLEHSKVVPEEIHSNTFFLNGNEEMKLKEMYGYMVGRIMVAYFPEVKWMESCIPKHIPHPYSQQMSTKSQIFPLKIILQDPKFYEGCIQVLNELTKDLHNCYVKAGRSDEFEQSRIILGGDQLVRVRMSGAKDLLAGAHSAVERVEHFSPIIEELFHIEQDFLEKLYKKLYSTKSMRQQGSLAFYKCQLKRTNVNGEVKGAFQPHCDFVHTIGEALLVQMCMKTFSMDTLESKPDFSNLNLPENIGKTHIKTRLPYFRQVVEQIVDEVYMGFSDLGCLPPVTVNVENVSVEIPQERLHKHGFVDLKFPSGATFRVYNAGESTDDLYNYTNQFLMWYLHFVEFQDGIKEGDPYRTNINIKRMIPFFYSHSNRSKYAVECIDYILKSEVLLPESQSMRLRLSSFVNPHGLKGGNKPADMQQENNILVLKDIIKGLGAHKTNNAMERASAAAPVIAETVENHLSNLGCHIRRGLHFTKDKSEDVKHLVDILGTVEPFEVVENRKMVPFSSFRRNPFSTISCEFQSHLLKIITRLRRGLNVDFDYYDQ